MKISKPNTMKTSLLSLAATFAITNAMAQQSDTIFPASASQACFTNNITYSIPGTGYITGTSSMQYGEFCQEYRATKSVTITGVLCLLHAPSKINNSNTLVRIYYVQYGGANNGQPFWDNLNVGIEQGTSNPVAMKDVKEIGYTYYSFAKPVVTGQSMGSPNYDFGVSVVMPTGTQDTLAVYSTQVGCYSNDKLAWAFKSKNYNWTALASMQSSNGPFNADLMIFPILNGPLGIEEENFMDGIKLRQNQPNPVFNYTMIQYELEKEAKNISLEVIDITGKLIQSIHEGKQSAGKHYIKLDTDKLAKGTYIYSLIADENRLTKQMIVAQ